MMRFAPATPCAVILTAIMLAACEKNTPPFETTPNRQASSYCEVEERLGGPVKLYPGDGPTETRHKTEHIAAYECACLRNCPKKP